MQQSRVPELDGVRGVAILTVLLWHCFYLTPDSTAAILYNRIAGLGWLGVDLFFVLSGYLITGILIADRERSDFFRRFYWRRALRIFPAYYFTLLMIFLFVPLLHPETASGKAIEQWPWFLLYMQNWGMALNVSNYDWPGIHHLWSVAIEEQFYMVWPLIIAFAPVAQLRRICVLLIVGSVGFKFLLAVMHAPWTAIYVSSVGRLEGLALGAFIATLTPADALHWRRWFRLGGYAGIAGMLVMLVTGASLMSKLTLLWAIPAATAAFGWLLFAIHTGSLPVSLKSALSGSALAWFGRYSYGLYLCHYAIYWCVRPLVPVWFGRDPAVAQANDVVLVTGVVALLLSMLYARLMFALIEGPALRLRDRWSFRRR